MYGEDDIDHSMVRDMCRTWGRERRAVFHKEDVCRPGTLWRLMHGVTRGAAPAPQEVYRNPDALAVARAIRRAIELHKLTDKQHEYLVRQYVDYRPSKVKAAAAGISTQAFYAAIRRAHLAIYPYLGVDKINVDSTGFQTHDFA